MGLKKRKKSILSTNSKKSKVVVKSSVEKSVTTVLTKKAGSKRKHDDQRDSEDVFPKENAKKIKKNKTKKSKTKKNDTKHNETKDTETKDNRTIFVGNVSLTTDKSTVLQLFEQFGPVENLRHRFAPSEKLKKPDQDSTIRKGVEGGRSGIICHVRFAFESSARAALRLNDYVLEGCKLCVDLAVNAHDNENSVFVGNISYDTEESALKKHFKSCGPIENVHIVRDRTTGLGKGVAYIRFKQAESIEEALELFDSKLNGRKIRVKRVDTKIKAKRKS